MSDEVETAFVKRSAAGFADIMQKRRPAEDLIVGGGAVTALEKVSEDIRHIRNIGHSLAVFGELRTNVGK